MKKAVIYVFSGTGNTQKIADEYAREFNANDVDTLVYRVTSDFSDLPDPNGFDYVGIAYPVHAFNAPSIVLDLIDRLPSTSYKKVFVLKTSGEPLLLNNASSLKSVSMLEEKGYLMTNEYHYVMPYNMIFRHTDAMASRMWTTAKALAKIEAGEILSGKHHYLPTIPFGRLISFIFRIEQPAMKFNGRFFKVGAQCTDCGACARNCPTQNIEKTENGLRFKGNCVMCARCSFNCPVNAIDIALLNGWKVNGKYRFDTPYAYDDEQLDFCRRAYERYFLDAERKIAGLEEVGALCPN